MKNGKTEMSLKMLKFACAAALCLGAMGAEEAKPEIIEETDDTILEKYFALDTELTFYSAYI